MARSRAERGGRERGIVVVKISGAIIESARIKSILGILARARRPLVIVPGGGALASAIDKLGTDLALSQAAAGRMAILAMHQTGMAIADLQPRLIPVETIAEMHKAISAGRIPVWLPLRLADRDHGMPPDQAIGSDGLAARLAERLGAILVLLVKAQRVRRRAPVEELAAQGVTDEAFASIVTRSALRYRLTGPGDTGDLAEIVGALAPRSTCVHLCRAGASRIRRGRRQAPRGAALGKQ